MVSKIYLELLFMVLDVGKQPLYLFKIGYGKRSTNRIIVFKENKLNDYDKMCFAIYMGICDEYLSHFYIPYDGNEKMMNFF